MTSPLITVQQLQSLLAGNQPLVVFDVRASLTDLHAGYQAWLEGHIPQARHVDLATALSAPAVAAAGRHPLPSASDFTRFIRSLGVCPQTQVVVYDDAPGLVAARLWWMLRWIGHERVALLNGGWQAWLAEGGAVQAGAHEALLPAAEAPEAADAAAMSSSMPVVDMGTIQANLSEPRFTIIDARGPERFRGETEPMDPVAGHIPGAVNRPAVLNLQAAGYFKPAAQLRAEFLSLLEGVDPATVVHQCGSGVTACHNLFAMELAGLPGSSLYPGSWSQWCSDASNPVALGES